MLLWSCALKMLEISCSLWNSVCETFRQSWLSCFCTRSAEGPENRSDLTPDIPLVLQFFRSEECFAIAVGLRVELI